MLNKIIRLFSRKPRYSDWMETVFLFDPKMATLTNDNPFSYYENPHNFKVYKMRKYMQLMNRPIIWIDIDAPVSIVIDVLVIELKLELKKYSSV